MIQFTADNLKPGHVLLNVGIINTVKITMTLVQITIVGAPPDNAERYFKPDELVYLPNDIRASISD